MAKKAKNKIMHGIEEILGIGVIAICATFCGMTMVQLRQPPIIGYIFAGVILGPDVLGFVTDETTIYTFGRARRNFVALFYRHRTFLAIFPQNLAQGGAGCDPTDYWLAGYCLGLQRCFGADHRAGGVILILFGGLIHGGCDYHHSGNWRESLTGWTVSGRYLDCPRFGSRADALDFERIFCLGGAISLI